jgi:hypothetical protein
LWVQWEALGKRWSLKGSGECKRLFEDAAQLAIAILAKSDDPDLRAQAGTLRNPLDVWLDLMRDNHRGFKRATSRPPHWRQLDKFEEIGEPLSSLVGFSLSGIEHLFEESLKFLEFLAIRDGVKIEIETQVRDTPARVSLGGHEQEKNVERGAKVNKPPMSGGQPDNASQQDRDQIKPSGYAPTVPEPNGAQTFKPADWDELEIRFLSDERIQIIAGRFTETMNYAEFGFEDSRSQKPNLAWIALRSLAEFGGTLRQTARDESWGSVEKRMQELRRIFRSRYALTSDPIPYIQGTGYKALFKIGCAPSFDK